MESQFACRNAGSSVESAPVMLCRAGTANGGWEWWLEIDGERCQPGEVGVFTNADVTGATVFKELVVSFVRRATHR